MNEIHINTDGGARGNPGPAALGVYIADNSGKKLAGIGKRIGNTTNNVAEYLAVIEALNWVIANKQGLKISKIIFNLDSQLVYSQIIGVYKVKTEHIRELIYTVKEKISKVEVPIEWHHVPRESNKKADELVNLALDNLI